MCPSLLIVASMNTKLKATWKGKGLFGLCVLITVDHGVKPRQELKFVRSLTYHVSNISTK